MSFVKRKIAVKFELNSGQNFKGASSNTVAVSGLRVSATINKAGPPGMGQTQLRIFGLSDTLMKQLSTYGVPVNIGTAAVATVIAGSDEEGMAVVSKGTITAAWAEYNQQPEVAMNVEVYEGYYPGLGKGLPTSINGAADAAQIMGTLAKAMGYAFENNGVNVKLDCPYFSGDLRTQAEQCAEAGGFNWYVEGGTLAIWPASKYRAGTAIKISPETGMVGYPTFMANSISVRTLLNPRISYGKLIEVTSSLAPACGMWGVVKMVSELESETPDGQWFTTVQALRPDYVQTVNQIATTTPSNL